MKIKTFLLNEDEGNSIVACKLPTLDPFHPSVLQFIKDLGKLHCEGANYSSFDKNVLRVEGEGIVSAQYRKIERTPGNDFGIVLSDPVSVQRVTAGTQKGHFIGNTSVDADFIRVEVVTSSGETKSDVHMHVFPKKEVLVRALTPDGIPLDVALIMFDSTSEANFKRKMPNSLKYLTNNLNSILLQGETIVGDGTTAQLAALLTGIEEKRQPEARRRKDSSQPVDSWRWIFNDFKEKGYATMFSEDSPDAASFNYRLSGFRDPPTDHYARPFWMAANKMLSRYCINSRASHDVSLKYLLSFFRSYKDRPKFAFSSHADISHNAVNPVGYADDDLKATLQTMEKESFLNNTLLIIFGDYGPRFSAFRKTIQGKLEERFPFMSITTPKWFSGKFPALYKNLVHNSRVLTSPFDVYATLRHILSYPQYPSGIVTGQSLFSRIDEKNRTCASAGVEDHWCPCLDLEEVSSNEPVVNEEAEFVVGYINNLTSQSDEMSKLCMRLGLKEIKSAFREMPKEAMQRFSGTKNDALDACDGCEAVMGDKADNTLVRDTLYQLQIVTSPNEGFYEASIRMKKGVPSLVGDISRIDAYKDQPYCIMGTFPLLR
ncbi:hypothetical protein OS493_031346 [Desmophyllum pertusum]|uniref:Uncharacterized protein n=1 Tax=Desmophyllum pertusum TaxID=174260 RepID=A0A9W9YWA2_9CNID|nr:hypothetical protein OS493_031346 [Desmophyllum pertusum]